MVKRTRNIAGLLAAFWAVFLWAMPAQAADTPTFNYAPPSLGQSAKIQRDDLALELTGIDSSKVDFTDIDMSAEIAAILGDETGSGVAVFNNAPTLIAPVLGAATATTINKVTITAPASAAVITIPDGVTLTGPAASGTAMTLGNTETVTGVKTFGSAGAVGRLKVAGTTSGTTVVDATATASGTLTLPAATDTLVGKATTDTLTNKTYDTAGSGNSFSINGVAATANTGTGAVARAAGPTFTTPTLGAATATTINKVTITAPASAAVITIPDGVTLTGPAASGTAMTLGNNETVTGVKTFGSAGAVGKLAVAGTTSGSTVLDATATASGTLTLPAATDTLVGKATTDTLTNKTLTTAVLNGTVTGTSLAQAATASTLVQRDANANSSSNAYIPGYTTTATAAGTTTLTVASTELQFFTGVTTQTVTLPVTSTMVLGQRFTIVNQSSGALAVNSSGANLVLSVAAGNTGIFTVVLTSGTSAASWQATYISSGAGTGTVTSVGTGTGLTGGAITTTGTAAFDFSDAGASFALNADECRFTSNATVAGYIICEGDTADTIETRIAITDPTASDKTFTIPNADSVAVQPITCSGTDRASAVSALGVVTCSTSAGTAPHAPVIKTSGTSYTTPVGCTMIQVEVVGGGGGGGNSGASSSGSGGGGGGYAKKFYTVVGNTAYTYAVGAAGAASGNGGNSTFTDGTTLITGSGGIQGEDSLTAIDLTATYAGGTGTNGDVNVSGDYGQNWTANGVGGRGGDSFYGAGGRGGENANGVTGTGFGGAGGGASGSSGTGGVGAAGVVIITEYY